MDAQQLEVALAKSLPAELARDFAKDFMVIRKDVAVRRVGGGSPGKFVETTVQALQALEQGGSYEGKPDVEKYFKCLESRSSSLPDGLRICATRVGRAMYSIRSKRNIVHKGTVDAGVYDLRFLYAGAQWVLAEILALTSGITAEEAGALIAQVQLPANELVETIDGRAIVHADMTVPEEVIVVLMGYHPDAVAPSVVIEALDRRAATSVRNAITALWKQKKLHRRDDGTIVLTEPGLRDAVAVAQAHAG